MCLIVGTSGKTNLLFNLILKKCGTPFLHFYIFTKSLEQEVYQNFKKAYENLSVKEDTEIAHFF